MRDLRIGEDIDSFGGRLKKKKSKTLTRELNTKTTTENKGKRHRLLI